MRLRWIALFIVLSSIGFLLWNSIFQRNLSSNTIQENILTHIKQNGFPNASIEKSSIFNEHVLLENIALDSHNFSTIGFIQVPIKDTDELYIKNATLTGELTNNHKTITIAGLNKQLEQLINVGLKSSSFKSIKAERINLDISTPQGIIRLETSAEIKKIDDNNYKVQALIWAKQKQFTIESNWSGTFQNTENFKLHAEIHSAKFDISGVQATRASGKIDLHNTDNNINLNGHMIAGAFRIFDIPFQNGRLDFMNDQKAIKATATGYSYSKEQNDDHKIDFSLSSNITDSVHTVELTSPRLENIIYSFTKNLLPEIDQKHLKEKLDQWPTAKNKSTLSITKSRDEDPKLTLAIEDIGIQPNATLSLSEENIIIKASALNIPSEEYIKLMPSAWTSTYTLSEGTIDMASNIGLQRLRTENPRKIAYTLKANGLLQTNNINFTKADNITASQLSGKIQLENLFPIKIAKNADWTASSLTFSPFNIPDAHFETTPTSYKTKLEIIKAISGGWTLKDIKDIPETTKTSATIEIKHTPLQNLTPEVSTNAIISGNISIQWDKNNPQQIEILEGIITTDKSGYIKIPTNREPADISDPKSQHLEAIKIALTNYEFDTMKIDIKPSKSQDITANFEATGKNSLSFGNRPIDINMNIDTLAKQYLPLILNPQNFQIQEVPENEAH